jgi:hypothetical protein
MCIYEELMAAIWGDEPYHQESELNHLVYELRRKIEADPSDPQFLQSVRGLGYRRACNYLLVYGLVGDSGVQSCRASKHFRTRDPLRISRLLKYHPLSAASPRPFWHLITLFDRVWFEPCVQRRSRGLHTGSKIPLASDNVQSGSRE